jgi:glycosyltransferase involved in cell wall biosynthesis
VDFSPARAAGPSNLCVTGCELPNEEGENPVVDANPQPNGAPLVSVVVPTNVHGPYLAEALASVQHQEMTDWELILVDDGSPDPEGLRREVSIDQRMRVIRHDHAGVAQSRNLGAHHARGRLLAFLDHDDAWYPDHLRLNIAALETNPDAVGAHTAYDVVEGSAGHWMATTRPSGPVSRHSVLSGGARPEIHELVVRRDAFDAVGGFNPDFDGAEDLDFIYKLILEGPFVYTDAVTVAYRVHDTNMTRKTRFVSAARERVMLDHLQRARADGHDGEIAALTVNRRNARAYYALVGLRDARRLFLGGDRMDAAKMALWSLRFSPRGAAGAITAQARKLAGDRHKAAPSR